MPGSLTWLARCWQSVKSAASVATLVSSTRLLTWLVGGGGSFLPKQKFVWFSLWINDHFPPKAARNQTACRTCFNFNPVNWAHWVSGAVSRLFSATWYMTGNHIHSIVLDLCEKDTLYLRNALLRCLPLSNQRDDTQCLSETEREEKHHGPSESTSASGRWRSKGLPQPRYQNNSSTIAGRTENIATSAKQIWSQCQMLKACEIILKWEQRGGTTANKCDGVNKL